MKIVWILSYQSDYGLWIILSILKHTFQYNHWIITQLIICTKLILVSLTFVDIKLTLIPPSAHHVSIWLTSNPPTPLSAKNLCLVFLTTPPHKNNFMRLSKGSGFMDTGHEPSTSRTQNTSKMVKVDISIKIETWI